MLKHYIKTRSYVLTCVLIKIVHINTVYDLIKHKYVSTTYNEIRNENALETYSYNKNIQFWSISQ